MAFDDAGARVPTQHRIVFALGTEFLRFLVVSHRLFEPLIGEVPAAWNPFVVLGLRAAFRDETRVIFLLVVALQRLGKLARFTDPVTEPAGELVREREKKRRGG